MAVNDKDRHADQPPTDAATRDVSEERNPHVEGPRVEKFGGKYGGPGVLVASWTDEHGETMNIVAHRIEGGYGTFKHVYPAKLVRPQTPREPRPDVPTDAAGMRERAVSNVMKRIDELTARMEDRPDLTEITKLRHRKREAEYILATCFDTKSLPLPPSPTADAMRAAEEALSVIQIVATEESQNGSGHNATMWAGVKATARDALAAIRKTKEG